MTRAHADRDASSTADRPTFKSFNPATGALIGSFPVHSAEDVASAVLVAREAAVTWWDLDWAGRQRALLRWVRHIARHQTELANLIHAENGKTQHDATGEILLALEHMRWAARNAESVLGSQKVSSGLVMFNHRAYLEHRPYGVVGMIGPWNYPVYTPMGSIVFALAAGNAVVFKPSEFTPAIGEWLVEAFVAANPELPRGVLTLITGLGETGAALCRSGVDKVAFTGSSATGRKIAAACAERLTPVVLECGGKDAMIVADDADVKAAAETAAWAGLLNGGQTCVGIELVYVTEKRRAEFLLELVKHAENVKPGAGPDADYGPMTMPGQLAVVRRHISEALSAGAKAILGGPESVGETFVSPVILVDVPDDCPAVTEETFGPVIVVRTVADVDEAVALINRGGYGLGSSVFSRNHGLEIARRLKTGMTAVNSAISFGAVPELPLGGNGSSGYGRIHGAPGLREFATTKSITVRRFSVPMAEVTRFDPPAVLTGAVRQLIRLRHGLISW